MTTAGSPATPAAHTDPTPPVGVRPPLPRRPGDPVPAAQSAGEPITDDRDSGPPVDDPLSRFLAEAQRRRDRHTREEAGRPEEWADPDPGAILRLPGAGHPVDRAIGRQRAGVSRDRFVGAVRRACERLQGAEPRSLSPADLRAYPWHHLDADRAGDYRRLVYALLTNQGSRNDAVSVVRRVVIQCYKAGLISAMRRDLVLEELYTVAPGPSVKRRRLTQAEINDLLAACERLGAPKATARNTAIVALFRTSGIRVSELTRIDLDDWDRAEHTILLRDTKNGRHHLIYLHPDAVPYLERWLTVRGRRPGALFTPLAGGGELRPLTPVSVRYMLKTRALAAGIAPFGSHDFRRTFATELLRSHDVALVGKLLNHKKTASTMVYDMVNEEEQRDAVARLDLPGFGDLTRTPPTPRPAGPSGDPSGRAVA